MKPDGLWKSRRDRARQSRYIKELLEETPPTGWNPEADRREGRFLLLVAGLAILGVALIILFAKVV